MSLPRISSFVFIGSLFGVLIVFGFIPPAWTAVWPVLVLLGLSAVGLVMWGVFSMEIIALWLKKRSTQFFLGMLLTAVASIAILTVVNWLAVSFNKKWDVTTNKLHSLSEQSRNVAHELKQKVTIRVWSQNVQMMSGGLDLRNFLENYHIANRDRVTVEFKNPNEDVVGARADNVKRDNIIIVKSESGRESRIENYSDNKAEEQVTNALIQAVKGGKKTICFLSGHGENSINSQDVAGMSMMRDSLSDSSYTPREFNLAESKAIPAECEAVIIAGPKGEAPEQELGILMDYLKGGGKMLVMFGAGTPEHWRKFTGEFGVQVNQDYLLDTESKPVTMVATKNYAEDVEITKGFTSYLALIDTSSLQVPPKTHGGNFDVKPFVSSRDRVIAIEGDIRKMREIRPKPSDFKGPLPLAVLITTPDAKKSDAPELKQPEPPKDSGWNQMHLPGVIATAYAQEGGGAPSNAPSTVPPIKTQMTVEKATDAPKAKNDGKMALIVVGNSSFALNNFVQQYGNMDFFLNTVSFLVKDKDMMGIHPRELKAASLELSWDRLRQVFATIFIISFLFLVGGITAHRRRSS